MTLLIDPRTGDAEDDHVSPERRSLLALAGALFAEVSLPKLLISWSGLILLPSLLPGVAPLLASAWLATVSGK